MNRLNSPRPRTRQCTKCKRSQVETFYGDGFPNWVKLLSVFNERNENPVLCPVCKQKLFDFLENKENKNNKDNVENTQEG